MSRYERLHEGKRFYLKTKIFLLTFLVAGLIIVINIYLKSLITIEAPDKDPGRKVVVQMENGKELQTYENLLIEKEGKMYYEGEYNTIEITGGTVVIQEWN